ncbi:MAG TPA: YceI family protein [Acidimicrobiales bacterium]|nr:YceI family protein [Acidimicrobiales bacterium]
MKIRTILGKHTVRNSVVLGVAVVVLAAVAGPFIYIHFIEGPPPATLSLPTTGTTKTTTGSSAGSLSGTLNIGTGSIVGYRVSEVLIGQNSTAVGRTSKVWGSIDVSGATITKATFSANMASVVSDQSQRNAQFDGRIMDVAQYPTATFTLTSPMNLGSKPSLGASTKTSATGEFTMHGVTKSITFSVTVERTQSGLAALAEIPIKFSTWNIANPSIGGFVTTAGTGTLEVLLDATKGVGNSPSSGGAASTSGGGTPITVPSTTVPRLKLPSN